MRPFSSNSMQSTNLRPAFQAARPLFFADRALTIFCALWLALSLPSFAQVPFATSRGDIGRTGANTNEFLLNPNNVNKNNFGHLFSAPVDYIVMAQPLYVPNVSIPGQGTHNVVYVVTQADSVYAIDADNGARLWTASMLNVGGTTASGVYLPCGTSGPGFTQEGIVGTPVIDPATNTMYLVAKTLLNATVRHHLHALDISTGNEQPGSPVLITATSTSRKGHVTVFNSLHQKNRPGLLLLNGTVYLGFGSNYCNDGNSGWVLSYNATPGSPQYLQQQAVFNTSPDRGLSSIWQAGNGLAADEAGNIFFETAEAGVNGFDVPSGGQTFCNSILKLAPDLTLADYFTPWNVAFLNARDYDLSSTGALVLPDQLDSPTPHELVASGKSGTVYVLNRDQLGTWSSGSDSQIIQEFALKPNTMNDVLFGSSAYWNHTVYFAPASSPILGYPVSGGLLAPTPIKSPAPYPGSHSPSISANGDNSNGVLWVLTGAQLVAFDAVSLKPLYNSNQALGGRDKLPPVGHFVTQTVANGRVYIGTQNSLEAYGLFPYLTVSGGNNQSAPVLTSLPLPFQVQVVSPYSGPVGAGITVTFSDGCKPPLTPCGTFNPPSQVTDSTGTASTVYTFPKKAGKYTLTASAPNLGSVTATETALPGPPVAIISYKGASQTGPAGSTLPNPIVAQVRDASANGVPGITVTFSAPGNGTLNPPSAVTDASGRASTTYTLPTTAGKVKVTATISTSSGLKSVAFPETAQ